MLSYRQELESKRWLPAYFSQSASSLLQPFPEGFESHEIGMMNDISFNCALDHIAFAGMGGHDMTDSGWHSALFGQ